MIFLDRTTLSVPNDWQKQAHKKLPDTEEYAQKALEFEALPINDPRRRRGFTQYAPEVLPKGRGKGRGKEKPDFPLCGVATRVSRRLLTPGQIANVPIVNRGCLEAVPNR
jgi:hypothetical protein